MGLEQQPALEAPHPRADCPFCTRQHLRNILEESQSFFLLADHAPLIEGHILLVPKAHYSCYGTVPPDLEPEFLLMKARATAFLRQAYRAPIFFEHGIFRQTVFHAHLHCFPFGKVELDLAAHHPHPAPHLKDVRDWYAEKGQYFYFEQRLDEGQLFLPEEVRYFSVLGALRQQAATHGTWQSPAERREHGRPKIASLVQKWQDFAQEEQDEQVRESSPDPIGRAQHKGENINGDGD
jgi:diadenosine tetraphosphate (Ap4A) HIT family hydrolase